MAKRTYRLDLHLHSCLSPCGDLEMSPRVIAKTAKALGLDVVALTDHQSTANCPAFARNCAEVGVTAWFGLEMNVAEEAHVLAIFDELGAAMDFGECFVESLPRRANDVNVWGEQIIVDADENVLGFEEQMLAMASAWDLATAVDKARRAGALVIASHVDRPYFSIPSQLGFLTGEEGLDAVEVSARAPWSLEECPVGLAGYPVVRNSDAHYAWQIAQQWNEVELERLDFESAREAIRRGKVRFERRNVSPEDGV